MGEACNAEPLDELRPHPTPCYADVVLLAGLIPRMLDWLDRCVWRSGACLWFAGTAATGFGTTSALAADSAGSHRVVAPNSGVDRRGILIAVDRAPGAESCPDADAVFRSMVSLYPERWLQRATVPEQAATSARVTIRPTQAGYEARVNVIWPRPGERVLVEPDPSCRGLGEALAVALSVFTDEKSIPAVTPPADTTTVARMDVPAGTSAEGKEPRKPPGTTTEKESAFVAKAAASPKPLALAGSAAPARSSWSLLVRGSGAAAYGVLNRPMVGGLFGIGLLHRSGFGIDIGAVGLWASPEQDGSGSIAVSRVGAIFGLCHERQFWSKGSYRLCAELGIGDQSVSTDGFPEVWSAARHDRWSSVGAKLGYVQELVGSLDGFVALGVQANLDRDNFLVRGSSAAVRTQVAGLVADLGLRWSGVRF